MLERRLQNQGGGHFPFWKRWKF